MILGFKPGRGDRCQECKNTVGVEDAYAWYKMERQMELQSKAYVYLFPALMIVAMFERIYVYKGGYTLRSFLIYDLVPWGLWVFNVFFLWPGKGVSIPGMKDRLKRAKDDLFLKKLGGEPVRKKGDYDGFGEL